MYIYSSSVERTHDASHLEDDPTAESTKGPQQPPKGGYFDRRRYSYYFFFLIRFKKR